MFTLSEPTVAIFKPQGEALPRSAQRDVKVLVDGQPRQHELPHRAAERQGPRPGRRFTAMTRLDHNRAVAQLAAKAGAHSTDVRRMTIWGNYSATQYPDVFHAEVGGKPGFDAIGQDQTARRGVHPHRPAEPRRRDHQGLGPLLGGPGGERGGRSRPARWAARHPRGRLGVDGRVSDGSYGAPEGIITELPCTAKDGAYEIVRDLEIDDFSRGGSTRAASSSKTGSRGQRPPGLRAPGGVRGARMGEPGSRGGRGTLFEELARGVVGEDLAVGLTGGAVGHV